MTATHTMKAGRRDYPSARQHLLRLTLVLMLFVASAMFFAFERPSSASAKIDKGPGYQLANSYRDSMIGGYYAPDRTVLYCLEWGDQSPTGPNDLVLNVTSRSDYKDWSHLEIARVNYLITKWGQTADNNQAAAVQMAIWMRHPGTREPFFSEHRFVKSAIPDANVRASIARFAEAMNDEANAFTPQSRGAIGSVEILPSETDPFAGTLKITGLPAHTRGTVVLTGATFDTTLTNSVVGVTDGDVLAYTGIPSDDEFGSYLISASATFVTPGGPGDELVVWQTESAFQDLGQSSTVIPDFRFTLETQEVIPLTFSPVLTTRAASTLVNTGEPLVDTVQFAITEGSLSWRQLSDGTFVELEAWCQAYGPLREVPEVKETPPADAPVFGERLEFTVGGGETDPTTETVEAKITKTPSEQGHYTFVCGIDQQAQTQEPAALSLPSHYQYQHEFGLVQETTLVQAPLAQTGRAKATQLLSLSGVVAVLLGAVTIGIRRVRLRRLG